MSQLIQNNSDFLFIYDAAMSNPNGDPDQENKPRMDYETKTNLVTDTRVKRYIRDYLKAEGKDIFVDMEGDSKVSAENKLKAIVKRVLAEKGLLAKIYADKPEYLAIMKKVLEEAENEDAALKQIGDKKFEHKEVNYHLLAYLVKEKFIDIRMFGSAFAVAGFTKSYTGAIQLNWGYSLNEVELLESNSIVTIMNDDSSTFGKDYRVKYSLLAFHGSVNKYAAKSTGLADNDLEVFRNAIWNSISALPTRSKVNQYPKAYVEIIYKDGFSNGQFGDLRNYITCEPKDKTWEQVTSLTDLAIDVSKLNTLLKANFGTDKDKAIKEIKIKISGNFPKISYT